jgi:hypothetical protein
MPVARTDSAWIALGFDHDLDVAADVALETMLDLMQREHGSSAASGAGARQRLRRPACDAGRERGKGVHSASPRCSQRRSPVGPETRKNRFEVYLVRGISTSARCDVSAVHKRIGSIILRSGERFP